MTILANHRPRLVIMVKEPLPGRVKTRLGATIGMTSAAWWFRHQTRKLIRSIQNPQWETMLAVSPDIAGLNSRVWPQHLPRIPQGSGDLGDRMARIFRSLPPGPVCIIGADIPGITPVHIKSAFQSLGQHDATFGPAPDGGYWLIGLKRTKPTPRTLFDNVRWSTEHALADTQATMNDLRIGMISSLNDVDTEADL